MQETEGLCLHIICRIVSPFMSVALQSKHALNWVKTLITSGPPWLAAKAKCTGNSLKSLILDNLELVNVQTVANV